MSVGIEMPHFHENQKVASMFRGERLHGTKGNVRNEAPSTNFPGAPCVSGVLLVTQIVNYSPGCGLKADVGPLRVERSGHGSPEPPSFVCGA